MPHATQDVMGDSTVVNGDKPSSEFLSHLTSYPVISDSLSTLKSHPYGQKSISVASSGYDSYGKPLLPYLSKPYSYVSPYITKADALGNSGLDTLDSKFPIVTRDTATIKGTIVDYAHWPLKVAGEGKKYVFDTYGSEVEKNGGQKGGVVAMGKAAITTGLVFTADGLAFLSKLLARKKEEGKEMAKEVGDKINN